MFKKGKETQVFQYTFGDSYLSILSTFIDDSLLHHVCSYQTSPLFTVDPQFFSIPQVIHMNGDLMCI